MTSSRPAARRASPTLAAAALAAASALGAASATRAQIDETEMLRFVVQATCADAAGRPLPVSPIDPACVRRGAQTAASPALYRKHDWASAADRAAQPLGYQASDSVLAAPPRGPGDAVVAAHTFDFGGPSGGFGQFDADRGDGGQVLALVQGSAAAFMTEDGGGGLQWFVGDGCRTGQRPRELAWLFFNDDVSRDGWREDQARLSTTRAQGECPLAFSTAYTRYIRADVALPFLQSGAATGTRNLDMIVSEHFDFPDVARSTHLERFYLARDLGLVRWERWQAAPNPTEAEQANYMAGSGRCPAVAFSEPPLSGWRMIDCRTWTNIVPQSGDWSVRRLGWPGVDARPLAENSYGGP